MSRRAILSGLLALLFLMFPQSSHVMKCMRELPPRQHKKGHHPEQLAIFSAHAHRVPSIGRENHVVKFGIHPCRLSDGRSGGNRHIPGTQSRLESVGAIFPGIGKEQVEQREPVERQKPLQQMLSGAGDLRELLFAVLHDLLDFFRPGRGLCPVLRDQILGLRFVMDDRIHEALDRLHRNR